MVAFGTFLRLLRPLSRYTGNLKEKFAFDLKKNFFSDEHDYETHFSLVISSLQEVNTLLNKKLASVTEWLTVFQKYNNAEAAYRKVDLYLFLRYAINMNDEAADKQSDSLINIIRVTRSLLKDKIASMPGGETSKIIAAAPQLNFFITSVIREKSHLLNAEQEKQLSHFQYLKSSSFYDRTISSLIFDKVITNDGEIDVFRQMSAWQNHPDEHVRKESEIKLFNGFAKQREAFGINYIHYIKGLDAFSKAKQFNSLPEEKLFNFQLPYATLENIFAEIISASKNKIEEDNKPTLALEAPLRFTITEATGILNNVFKTLGSEYHAEGERLLDPDNGRLDIVGGDNRIPIRGTASVYPVFPSIFYAFNYEGYLIDLTLLAHEAGHAIQASLMTANKVPLMYGSGPGYFTESFGKFNELLLFDHLSTTEKDLAKKNIYTAQLKERLNGLFGAAEEAYIEYALINGILANKINNANDLDSVTQHAGSSISPGLYNDMPERKNLWMLLETNFRAPMHNINDMIAAALAIKYFQMYKTNGEKFVPAYLKLLKEGYHDSPAELLKKVDIDIQNPEFIREVIHFISLK